MVVVVVRTVDGDRAGDVVGARNFRGGESRGSGGGDGGGGGGGGSGFGDE